MYSKYWPYTALQWYFDTIIIIEESSGTVARILLQWTFTVPDMEDKTTVEDAHMRSQLSLSRWLQG